MGRTLIVFDTVSGSTRDMAGIIRDAMKGAPADTAFVDDAASLSGYETIILGSPIRFGGFTAKMRGFIGRHRTELSSKRIILYFSSLYLIHLKEEAQPAVPIYIDPALNIQTISKKDAGMFDRTHSMGYCHSAVLKQTRGLTLSAVAYFSGRLDLGKLILIQRVFMRCVTFFTTKERVGDFMNRESVGKGAAFFDEILTDGGSHHT